MWENKIFFIIVCWLGLWARNLMVLALWITNTPYPSRSTSSVPEVFRSAPGEVQVFYCTHAAWHSPVSGTSFAVVPGWHSACCYTVSGTGVRLFRFARNDKLQYPSGHWWRLAILWWAYVRDCFLPERFALGMLAITNPLSLRGSPTGTTKQSQVFLFWYGLEIM